QLVFDLTRHTPTGIVEHTFELGWLAYTAGIVKGPARPARIVHGRAVAGEVAKRSAQEAAIIRYRAAIRIDVGRAERAARRTIDEIRADAGSVRGAIEQHGASRAS